MVTPKTHKQQLSKSLKNKTWFMLSGAEVAQFGRALDSTKTVVEGEAEDRVVAGSSPALGTIINERAYQTEKERVDYY